MTAGARVTAVPLTALLSQVLVALTIETDNEYEHRAPRGTGAWLISTAMYVNFLRFVPPEGVRMAEVAANAGAPTPVHPAYHGMRRWGYVRYSPDIKGTPRARDGEAVVHVTPAGGHAQQIWKQVITDVEARWTDRGLDALRAALVPVAASIEPPMPSTSTFSTTTLVRPRWPTLSAVPPPSSGSSACCLRCPSR